MPVFCILDYVNAFIYIYTLLVRLLQPIPAAVCRGLLSLKAVGHRADAGWQQEWILLCAACGQSRGAHRFDFGQILRFTAAWYSMLCRWLVHYLLAFACFPCPRSLLSKDTAATLLRHSFKDAGFELPMQDLFAKRACIQKRNSCAWIRSRLISLTKQFTLCSCSCHAHLTHFACCNRSRQQKFQSSLHKEWYTDIYICIYMSIDRKTNIYLYIYVDI